MSRPIRVLLDVTLFGTVQEQLHIPHVRAGIHRVVEQTVRMVGNVPDVALTLCSGEKPDASNAYLQAHRDLRTLPFAIPARKRLGKRLSAHVSAEYERAGAHSPRVLPARVANRVLRVANRVLDPRSAGVGMSTLARTDVFHSPVQALPEAKGRMRGVRYFLTVYDLIAFLHPEFSSWGGSAWLRRVIDSIGPNDHVLTISRQTRHDLLNARPDLAPEHVHVTHLAADVERFYRCNDEVRIAATRARYNVPHAPYLLSVGTLEPRKNLAHLIKSFAAVVRAEGLDDLHLVLTGDPGWDYDAIFAEAGRLDDLRERIIFTGYVADEDLAPLYSDAMAFVYPSLYEGFGLPPLEAMQCGAPVITGNTSSLPEVVGDAGMMVDPRDDDALAQAILDVYRDSCLRADLSRRALTRARDFSWMRYAEETVAAYRAAL